MDITSAIGCQTGGGGGGGGGRDGRWGGRDVNERLSTLGIISTNTIDIIDITEKLL